jgi:ADP-heptose:LPS heptosyltransferase
MKEIAIIAIARYGDLIQTTPLLRILKKTYPDARITMIVEDRFSGILPMIRGYDRIIALDKRDLAVDIIQQDDPLVPYKRLDDFVRKVEQYQYDMVINLTSTKFSAHLTSLMQCVKITGITANDTGQRSINSLWALYLFSWFYDNARKYNRINLVDIFTRLGGVLPDGNRVELFETDKGIAAARKLMQGKKLGSAKLVGLQLGASDPIRCWPAENFARLSDMLQGEFGVRTILFGSTNEKHLAEKAKAHMKLPTIDAVGKTDMEGLLSLVKSCTALVSNDTGTMHFAAAAGVPAVMLCLGPAFFRCTGPYGSGHLAMQPNLPCSPCQYGFKCADPACQSAITPEAVFAACGMLLNVAEPPDFSRVKVSRSEFTADGYLTWKPICNSEAHEEADANRYEQMWKNCLDGSGFSEEMTYTGFLNDFFALMQKGIKIASEIVEASRKTHPPAQRIKNLGVAEAAVEAEMKLMGGRFAPLVPMVNFLTLMRENIIVEDLGSIAEETREIYRIGKKLAAGIK